MEKGKGSWTYVQTRARRTEHELPLFLLAQLCSQARDALSRHSLNQQLNQVHPLAYLSTSPFHHPQNSPADFHPTFPFLFFPPTTSLSIPSTLSNPSHASLSSFPSPTIRLPSTGSVLARRVVAVEYLDDARAVCGRGEESGDGGFRALEWRSLRAR